MTTRGYGTGDSHLAAVPPAGHPTGSTRLFSLLQPGQVFCTEGNAYLLLQKLGQGGSGVVFLALCLQLVRAAGAIIDLEEYKEPGIRPAQFPPPFVGQLWAAYNTLTCVLKILTCPDTHPNYHFFLDRMRLEARCYGAIEEPRVPHLLGAGLVPLPHLALEYVRGETLETILGQQKRGVLYEPPPWKEIQDYCLKIALALECLHGQNLVHRDLKPGNIVVIKSRHILGGSYVRLIDFGLAKYVPPAGLEHLSPDDWSKPLQKTLEVLSLTPGFAAAEQLDRRIGEISAVTDIHAFGATIFMMVTGRLPFQGNTLLKLIEAMKQGPIWITHPELKQVSRAQSMLNGLVKRMLAFEPRQRISSVGAVQDALTQISETFQEETRTLAVRRVRSLTPRPVSVYPARSAANGQVQIKRQAVWWCWLKRIALIILALIAAAIAAPEIVRFFR